MPKDKAANYCFRPPLQLTRLGVVVPGTVLSSLNSEEGRQGCRQAQAQARAAAFPEGEPLIMVGRAVDLGVVVSGTVLSSMTSEESRQGTGAGESSGFPRRRASDHGGPGCGGAWTSIWTFCSLHGPFTLQVKP